MVGMTEVKPSSGDTVFVKQHLISQIDNLKADIQGLLNTKRGLTNSTDIAQCVETKQKKMETLRILNDKLKEINKREREEAKRRNDLRFISRAIDSLEFGAAKKQKNSLAMERAKMAKVERDNTRVKYLEYQTMERRYLEYDCPNLPAFLFLHKDILKTYGLCPYLDIDFENVDTEALSKSRGEWLASQSDGGVLYSTLYRDIHERGLVKSLVDERVFLETEISEFIRKTLSDSQMDRYVDCEMFLKEYVGLHVKTKRIKDRFKTFVHSLSVLYSETGVEIHKYLSAVYDVPIIVNTLDSRGTLTSTDRLHRSMAIERFEEYITRYTDLQSEISKNEKYCTNVLKNLKVDLYSYLTDKQAYLTRVEIPDTRVKIVQKGAYYKKWSALTDTERLERFNSYAVFYVDKNLVEAKLLDRGLRDTKVAELQTLLQESFQKRTLLYKNIVWNVKRGIIENIKVLLYNDDNTFGLIPPKPKVTENTATTATTATTVGENTTTTTTTPSKQTDVRRRVSSKSIITKETEKVINEELLKFILRRISNGESTQQDKDDFLERLKLKLKIKKITTADKTKLFNTYDEMFSIVKNRC